MSDGFGITTACMTGQSLAPGEGCSVTVRFAPVAPRQESGALWLRDTTSTPEQLITFYGRGTGVAAGTSTLSFAPAPLQLPTQAIGAASAPTSLQLQNRGGVAITPIALVFNGPAAYELSAVGDCAVGRTIPAGGACFLAITFTPQATGRRLANLVVDAPQLASLAILQIAGTGVSAAINGPPAVEIVEFHHPALILKSHGYSVIRP